MFPIKPSEYLTFTACPRCDKSPLTEKNGQLRCAACKVDFPAVAGMPWLFAEPDASLGEWRNRLHFALRQLANQSQRIRSELEDDGLAQLTRERLNLLANAYDKHRNKLRELLSPVDVHSSATSFESYLALRTRLPVDQGIATYYANIHRDWAWGDVENGAALEIIREVADDLPLGSTFIPGAGAGRLAYDIHMHCDTTLTLAMDFNPLLMLLAQKMFAGDEAELYEFPLAPTTLNDVAVLRNLRAPAAARDGLALLFGDALRPPLAPGTLDTVVTPWLVDVIDEDFQVQARRINRLLKPGGRWINFGSLAFDQPQKARCYSTDEVLVFIAESGFEIDKNTSKTIPYMCSPASRHGRQESVFAFSASKKANVEAPIRHKSLPDWLVTGQAAVPLTQSFRSQAMTTQIYSYVMSMIDGRRTINDMAKILEQQKLMTRKEALPAVRGFLTRMYDDSQRKSGF